MRLLVEGTAYALWVIVPANTATDKSIRQRLALLTIVSFRDSLARVKRFYELRACAKNERWGRAGMCAWLGFPYSED
jgi:hypothetical protein